MIETLHETLRAVRAHRGTMRDAALMYAAAGLEVFPCVPGGKQPLTTRGYRDATTGARRIRGWWAWQPEANIGIATGHGLDVLDVDVHAGGDGYRTLERLHRAGMVPERSPRCAPRRAARICTSPPIRTGHSRRGPVVRGTSTSAAPAATFSLRPRR